MFAEETGRPVRLVGWSLGGYLVREVARERPDLVEKVITLGTPVIGGPKYTASAPMYTKKGYDLDVIEAGVAEREAVPIRVPIEAIYSRTDGIVAWRACIDHHNPDVRHHEVVASHLGLVASPSVFRLVATLLEDGGARHPDHVSVDRSAETLTPKTVSPMKTTTKIAVGGKYQSVGSRVKTVNMSVLPTLFATVKASSPWRTAR